MNKEDIKKELKRLEALGLKVVCAGGYPLRELTGKDYVTDVDIYVLDARDALRLPTDANFTYIYEAEYEDLMRRAGYNEPSKVDDLVKYETGVRLIGEKNYFQLITLPRWGGSIQHVFDEFDINLCKVAMDPTGLLISSPEALKDIETKQLTVKKGLPLQLHRKTFVTRVPKYLERFPDFRVGVSEVGDE